MKTSKSFNQEYIEKAKTLIHEILEDKKEYDDWTQICFSMQNAVQAAANIWGISSDEQINKMRAFITEMVLIELSNLKQFDIVFKKKGIRSLPVSYTHLDVYKRQVLLFRTKFLTGESGVYTCCK